MVTTNSFSNGFSTGFEVGQVVDRYWVRNTSGSTGTFSDTANWSGTSGGAGGSSVPASGDDIFFDSAGDSGCVVD